MKVWKRAIGAVTAGALLAASLAGCSGDGTYSADMAEYAYEKGAPSLCQAYEDYFQVGAAINPSDLEEGSDRYKIIDKQFNVFTLENGTKAENIHPQEDVYDFEATDQLVEYGQANGKTVRGHTLVWYSQCPEWFFLDDQGNQVSAEVLIQRMKEHITTIVSRYKGKIHTWDVCNEVLDDSFGLRQSEWLNIIGDYDGDGDSYDYIEIAFQTAHEADPDARLILNDYSLEANGNKAITMYNMVKQLLEEGVPIDGIGLQMHIDHETDLDAMDRCMRVLGRLREIDPDFVLEVTELDMSCFTWNDTSTQRELTEEFVQQFDEKYCQVFSLLMDYAQEGLLDTVVFWGYDDGSSWLNEYPVEGRTNHPLLIDRELKFKSAYWALMNLPQQRAVQAAQEE